MKFNFENIEWDDMLCDVYIFDMNSTDWQNFIKFLAQAPLIKHYYKADKEILLTPDLLKKYIEEDEYFDLQIVIYIDSIELNLHIYSHDEFEMCFDPSLISDDFKLDTLFNFLSSIAINLTKQVIITHENNPKRALFTFSTSGEVLE